MKKIKIGVMGVGRGRSMIKYCKAADNAELVAICDKWEEGLERAKRDNSDLDIAYYTDFDAFIKHDMDAVVLANYANEHAPFAIRAMREGTHVFSEVLPCQTMKEAVELIEAVEDTGMIYAYGENYCYMPGPYEMRRLYREGKIGEFEYGEGEYVHNCEPIWPEITYGEADHWRNNMYSTFYCTHSMGPLVHITGLRPVSVTGFEGPLNAKNFRNGAKGASFGVEMVTLENGAVVKSIHGCFLHRNSIWYTAYGTKGRMETAREDAEFKDVRHLYVNAQEQDGVYEKHPIESYKPAREFDEQAIGFGHGGSDFYSMWHFAEKIKGNPAADVIDVYEAMDMFLPGLFAYRSILAGGSPMDIPNLRDKTVREQYRSDTACTDPKVAGDQLLPTAKGGTPEIGTEVYEAVRQKWLKKREK
ncbi:MAG: Gfo/Idh/MocA family oxidoreductase [Clostridia bacterium]|nr:Gfo/Idh/MocA family oxidoreductase [Clostridia bacterium]